jgi:hypothetical protein
MRLTRKQRGEVRVQWNNYWQNLMAVLRRDKGN